MKIMELCRGFTFRFVKRFLKLEQSQQT
jgi:hypothetical protein